MSGIVHKPGAVWKGERIVRWYARASCLAIFVALTVMTATLSRAATFNVSDSASYYSTLQAIALDPISNHTIFVTADFTLLSDVPPITANSGASVVVNGNGHTIDGGGLFRPFFIHSGNVQLNNLTIANGMAQGGRGSGGGMGAGGAIFVDQFAIVTLNNVSFANNTAIGGSGGRLGVGGGGLGGDAGFDTGTLDPFPPFQEGHSSGGGGLYGSGGTAFEEGGGGGGGALGNGGNGTAEGGLVGGGGGGGFFGNGGHGSNSAGGGGGGFLLNGSSAVGGTAGLGGGIEGGNGGASGVNGSSGLGFGGGGGSGGIAAGGYGGFGGGGGGAGDDGGAGGNGGYFGGGGGADYGDGGDGGDFGGGGGTDPGRGGDGGFGGGGGGSLSALCGCPVTGIGGLGGFGGGGGAGPIGGGIGGFAGGNGSTTGGGGGGALGGAIFVRNGGTLIINGAGSLFDGTVSGGSGAGAGSSGLAFGDAMFLQGNGALTLSPGVGETFFVSGDITDQTGAGGTGPDAGAYSLLKNGPGVVSLSGTYHFSSGTQVTAGELNLNGILAGDVVVFSGAILSGNATVLGNLTLSGVVSPGNSPGTVSVNGNFIGGGTLLTEVLFNSADIPINGTTHDFLNIAGNVSGTTLLNIVPFAPSNAPALTTGNGIELVRVGGTTSASAFQLATPVIVGALEYTLNYLPNYSGILDGYFLQSRVSESMYGEAAMLAAGQAMIAGCLTGEDALVDDGNAHRGRGWAKAARGNRDTGADTGLSASIDYSCVSGGIDIAAAGQVRVGLSGGYGTSDSDMLTPAGAARLEGDGGIVQLYVEFHSGDFFASLNGGWGVFDWTFDGPNTGAAPAQLDGMIGALQMGHYWQMDWLRLGALSEITYNGMDCGADCVLAGTRADGNEWFYKATVRVDSVLSNGELKPHLALSLAEGGTNTVTNGITSLTTDTNAVRLVAKGGASFMVDTQTALFLNGGYTEGLDNDTEGWEVGAGITAIW